MSAYEPIDLAADPPRTRALLARRGFRDPEQARQNLIAIGREGTPPARAIVGDILEAFSEAADPDLGLTHLERMSAAIEDRSAFLEVLAGDSSRVRLLATVLGGSSFLAGVLIQYPECLDALFGDDFGSRPQSYFLERARNSCEGCDRKGQRLEALHRFQLQELLRIGSLDLAGRSSLREVTNELSWLADAIIQCVFDEAWGEYCERAGEHFRMAVIGMGKLGGEELNFSSDIDFMYVCSDEPHIEAAARVARKINRYLTDPTKAGVFYRVDLRLRPQGSQGFLAPSIEGLRDYYSSWGETFERLALSKARPVAGDPVLGRQFIDLVQPFVYRKYLDFAAIEEVRAIKQKIDAQVHARGEIDRNVKLGRGGIREIEFFVQALQILYGGDIPEIRVRSTLEALVRLKDAGLIDDEVSRRLQDAYAFLRNVEHKLQIVDQRQTHTLPDDDLEIDRCAQRMRMSPGDFRAQLKEHRSRVHAVFEDLFPEPEKSADPAASNVQQFVAGNLDDRQLDEWLTSVGFEDIRQAKGILSALRDAPAFGHSPSRMRNLLTNVLTPLMEVIRDAERKGLVLGRFERLTQSIGAREALFRSLLENPQSIARLARLFDLSDPLSEAMVERPGRSEFLIDEERLHKRLGPPFETVSRETLEFCLGVQYLFGLVSRKRASRLMSRFAGAALERVLPPSEPVAVFALGKFGERELNYRSDLDIVAFYVDDFPRAANALHRAVSALKGEFKVDLRLRPEGRKGSDVWSLEHTRAYFDGRAAVWERMAWSKSRFVAGDPGVADRFRPVIENFVYGQEFHASDVQEMKRIRNRMEVELAREEAAARDLKTGYGGLVDLEFLAEFLQIRHGMRLSNTEAILKRAGRRNLAESYAFLRETESALRLWSRLASSRIEKKDWAGIERILKTDRLEERYQAVTRGVREAFEAYV